MSWGKEGCELKLRSKVVGTVRKFPGIPKITGYPNAYLLGAEYLMSMRQVSIIKKYIINFILDERFT
jgi:hypothetical protein